MAEPTPDPSEIDFEGRRKEGKQPSIGKPIGNILGHAGYDHLTGGGSSAPTSTGGSYPVGSANNGGTMMSDGTITPPADGSSFTDPGSTAGTVSSAIRAGKTGYDYFSDDGYERDRNKQAVIGGSMAVANYFTGGLAEAGKMGAEKLLGPKLSGKLENAFVQQSPIYHLMNAVGSKKNEDQVKRDQIRKSLQSSGALDAGFNLTNSDGSKVNIGLDGGARPDYASADGSRRGFEVNTDNPLAPQATSLSNLLATAVSGGDEKLKTQYAGYFANASMVGAKSVDGVRANLLGYAQQMGLNREQLVGMVDSMKKGGQLDDQGYAIMTDSVNQLFGAAPKQGGSGNISFNVPRAQPYIMPAMPAPQKQPIAVPSFQNNIQLGTDPNSGVTRPVVQGAPQVTSQSYMPKYVPGAMAPAAAQQQPVVQRKGPVSTLIQR